MPLISSMFRIAAAACGPENVPESWMELGLSIPYRKSLRTDNLLTEAAEKKKYHTGNIPRDY
jgi:hypothetical protein